MFSCCRANPKHSKKDKHKNEDETAAAAAAADDNATTTKSTTKTDETEIANKKLIIPTITVENGGKQDETANNDDGDEADHKNDSDQERISNADIKDTNEKEEEEVEEVAAHSQPTPAEQQQLQQQEKKESANSIEIQDENTTAAAHDKNSEEESSAASELRATFEAATNGVEIANNDKSIATAATSLSTTTTTSSSSSSSSTTSSDSASINQCTNNVTVQAVAAATTTSKPTTTVSSTNVPTQPPDRTKEMDSNAPNSNHTDMAAMATAATGVHAVPTPARSCLSRHNSTHTSIKKKVNISTRAEIIEPKPLPILLPSTTTNGSCSLADDDEVFSDSLPAPKRESMCAPYLERDELISEAIAFSHGLPAWFDDERLNEIGCIEPPVTPVGRDELELRRQRLYTDLLRAAHAAVEHSVRFTPFGATGTAPLSGGLVGTDHATAYNFEPYATKTGACDPDLKPSIADNLEQLVNRLELLVERLERSVSARELEIANRAFDTVLERKRQSIELETQPIVPTTVETLAAQLTQQAGKLNQRIERIETSLQRINSGQHSESVTPEEQQQQQKIVEETACLIPTVLADYNQAASNDETEDIPLPPPPPSMSVLGFQDIVAGPLNQYLTLSSSIGGDVAKHAELVKAAFDAQLQYVTLATQIAQPPQDKQMELLKPTSTQISAIQDFREKQRASTYFNHLSAISESIPALGWVCVAPTPGPHVKEMNDAGQFYTNRVLKEWKEKDAKHVEWARAWVQTLTELQAYIKQYHTTGLVWSGKGAAPAGGAPPPPPPCGLPPPPPPLDLSALKLDAAAGDDRSALFAQINQGEAITKNLKKVTADLQTHKNPSLRTGPAPFKTPAQFGSVSSASNASAVAKPPVFTRDGKKWLIEYQKNNTGLLVDNAEMNNVVYMFRCEGSTLTVKGKVNNIVLDSCKKCSLLFDSVVASVEFVNCQSVQMQTLGFVPTVSIDKTDGCQMYLSKDSMGVEIVSSKSSEMNILLPDGSGDYTELAVPEQFKTTISGKTLKTVCVDSLG